MAGVPGTASGIFGTVKDVGANVIMISQVSPSFSVCLSWSVLFIIFLLIISLTQASSEHSICFAVPEKEVTAVSAALQSRFRQALDAGRLSRVNNFPFFSPADMCLKSFVCHHINICH